MRKLLILLSLIPMAAVAMPSDDGAKQCGDKHHHMKTKKSGDVPFYLRDMDLSDAQKAQLKTMMEKKHADKKADKTAYWENKKAIKQLTKAETLDEAALEQLVDKSLVMHKEHAMQRARFHHEMFQLLTPEQQQQLEQKIAKHKEKMAH